MSNQYQVMTYRILLASPETDLGAGTTVTLPEGWCPLSAVRQGDTIVILCSQQIADTPPPQGPAPHVDTITPNTAPAGSTPITIDVTGTGFDNTCTIYADASPRATFFLDATHLQYTARPDLEPAAGTVQIKVQGDTGTSNALPFAFT